MCNKENFQTEIAVEEALSQPFNVTLERVMKVRKKTREDLAEDIGVSAETISRYRSGETHPDIRMAVAICIACSLNLEQSKKLLNSLGFSLEGASKEIKAYRYLIEHHSGEKILECNKILTQIGIIKRNQLYPRKGK